MEAKFVKLAKLRCTRVITDLVQLHNGVLKNAHILFPRDEYMFILTL
jgi:hypothetical protein